MSNLLKRTELLANVAIIVVAVLLCFVLVKRYILDDGPAAAPPQAQQIQRGTKITLPGVDWSQSDRTLLLVLSDNCRYCTQSGPFYQRLAQEKKSSGARMVAVLPQEVGAGRSYMEKLGVEVDDVRQSQLNAVGVRGTPTLLLVDRDGAVTDSWVGQLPPDKEAEVVASLHGRRASR